MNRRLQDRLPPALLARMRQVPHLVLIVTTTIVITPEAWARIVAGNARPIVAAEVGPAVPPGVRQNGETIEDPSGKSFTRRYSKAELAQQVPNNPSADTTLDARLMHEITGLLNKMSASFGGASQAAALDGLKTQNPTGNDYALHVAALADEPKQRSSDPHAVQAFLAGEAQKSASASAKERSQVLHNLGSGFNFNLDLMPGKSADAPPPGASGQVRYGLLVQEIHPDMDAARLASVNDTTDELQYAGHADVKWTIGPLTEDNERPIFNQPTGDGDGNDSKYPRAKFKGNATPENFENFAKVDQKNPPLWRFEVAQEDDLYKLTYRTKVDGKKVNAEHAFRAPVAGTIAVGRRFTDNWNVIETSAYNVLYDKRLPLLSLHYMHIEQRAKADVTKQFGPTAVGLEGRGKATGKTEKPEDKTEAYSLKVTREL